MVRLRRVWTLCSVCALTHGAFSELPSGLFLFIRWFVTFAINVGCFGHVPCVKSWVSTFTRHKAQRHKCCTICWTFLAPVCRGGFQERDKRTTLYSVTYTHIFFVNTPYFFTDRISVRVPQVMVWLSSFSGVMLRWVIGYCNVMSLSTLVCMFGCVLFFSPQQEGSLESIGSTGANVDITDLPGLEDYWWWIFFFFGTAAAAAVAVAVKVKICFPSVHGNWM